MSVRAKFVCVEKSEQTIRFLPVTGGSPENDKFFQATPGGELRFEGLTNAAAAAQFEEGKEYFLDVFLPSSVPPVNPIAFPPEQPVDVDPMEGVAPEQFEKEKILRFFRNAHLPEPLRALSRKFAALAVHVTAAAEPSAERTVALRKLLEGKDAAVRAILPPK